MKITIIIHSLKYIREALRKLKHKIKIMKKACFSLKYDER